jgi:energy-coupling factor transporter transmembrane protein EcfT
MRQRVSGMNANLISLAEGMNIGQRLGNFIVGVLAVAGAGLVGYLFVALVLRLSVQWVARRRLPKSMSHLLSVTGGVAAALFVAWMVFFGTGGGFGWGGWGLGGGLSDGTGTRQEVGEERNRVQEKAETEAARPPSIAGESRVAPAVVSILLLGGDRVRGEMEDDLTFYQVLPNGTAMGLREIRMFLRQRKTEEPPVREIVLVIRTDSVAQNHPAVRRLEEWAKEAGLGVSYRIEP